MHVLKHNIIYFSMEEEQSVDYNFTKNA